MVTVKKEPHEDRGTTFTFLVPNEPLTLIHRMTGTSPYHEVDLMIQKDKTRFSIQCDTTRHCNCRISERTAGILMHSWSTPIECETPASRLIRRDRSENCLVKVETPKVRKYPPFDRTVSCRMMDALVSLDLPDTIDSFVEEDGDKTLVIPPLTSNWFASVQFQDAKRLLKQPFSVECNQETRTELCRCSITLIQGDYDLSSRRKEITCDVHHEHIELSLEAAVGVLSESDRRTRRESMGHPVRDYMDQCHVQINRDLLIGVLSRPGPLPDFNGIQNSAYNQICSDVPINTIRHEPIPSRAPNLNTYNVGTSGPESDNIYPLLPGFNTEPGQTVVCSNTCHCSVRTQFSTRWKPCEGPDQTVRAFASACAVWVYGSHCLVDGDVATSVIFTPA